MFAMTLMISTLNVPLKVDKDNVVRIGDTRVTLDTVVTAFQKGATAEEIVQQYPSLELADVYSVIGYYLQRRSEVENYLGQRRRQINLVRSENEAKYDPQGIRDRLLARLSRKE
jgi:uncharacterized protein (DUF433 family)